MDALIAYLQVLGAMVNFSTYGVEGRQGDQTVRLGRAVWVGAVPVAMTATYLSIGDAVYVFRFTDQLRPGAIHPVSALRSQGKAVRLLSGDTSAAVAEIAGQLGITDWVAGALPAEKMAIVQNLAKAGHKVLMVGDGLNDTAALAAAHVSISPASALDAARVASDIVLLGRDMATIADAARISGQATRQMIENFLIAAGYNVIAVPLALMGHATPLAAAMAMSLSSITVSLNAIRLR